MYNVFIKSPELDEYVKELIIENPGANSKLIKRKLAKKVNYSPRAGRRGYDDICYPMAISMIAKKLEQQGLIVIATRDLGNKEISVYLPIDN